MNTVARQVWRAECTHTCTTVKQDLFPNDKTRALTALPFPPPHSRIPRQAAITVKWSKLPFFLYSPPCNMQQGDGRVVPQPNLGEGYCLVQPKLLAVASSGHLQQPSLLERDEELDCIHSYRRVHRHSEVCTDMHGGP